MNVEHVNLDIKITPEESSLTAIALISFNKVKSKISGVILNPDLSWDKVIAVHDNKEYQLKPIEIDIPEDILYRVAKAWEFKLPSELNNLENLTVSFTYFGKIMNTTWDLSYINSTEVELADYGLWYPYLNNMFFSFNLTLHAPEDWIWISNAYSKPCKDCFKWRNSNPQSGIVLIGFPEKQAILERESGILEGSKKNFDKFSPLETEFKKIVKKQIDWLGSPNQENFSIVLVRREKGGAYVRGNLMIYPEELPEEYFTKHSRNVITSWIHEHSHLWFNKSPSENWHNWIDESLAEYSAYLMAKEHFGDEFFDTIIRRRKEIIKETEELPAINSINRLHEKSYTLFYHWGALIHESIREKIGTELMKKVIRNFAQKSLNRKQVDTTDYIESLNEVTKEDWTDIIDKKVSSIPDTGNL
ncbi:MAG: hypothetical protein H7641_09790 [Candidatus Heimdallarchaeota archaeon]|nr:hypothetical protein [Candidatus Heimdallarchaeota archaeon]MCK4877853.1 hypothetical protein [Candidatus Heimdallarchaeota archaeon]